jgi:uncharacterized protein
MRSHLLEGVVRHRRARPVTYSLEHGVYYLALDLDEMDVADRSVRLLSRGRPNVLSFRDEDHLDPPATDLPTQVRDYLATHGIDATGWQITLVANARVFGYVFDPASFYLCRDASGSLRVVIVEVHNTHGERHLYLLHPAEPQQDRRAPNGFEAAMEKDFYVSPFIDLRGRYRVIVRDEARRLRITINEEQDGKLVLHASLDLARRPLSDRSLATMLIRHPLVTWKTTAMIHIHAFHLWRRGLPFHRHREAARVSEGAAR